MVTSAEEAESSASSASSDRPSAVLSFVALPRTPRAGLMSGEIIFRISLWFIYTGICIYKIYNILYDYDDNISSNTSIRSTSAKLSYPAPLNFPLTPTPYLYPLPQGGLPNRIWLPKDATDV